MKHMFLRVLPLFAGVSIGIAQSPPPGIPEPGIVIYGLILAADGVQTVPAQSVSLRFAKEGAAPIAATGEVVTGEDGRWRYVARIPFETVLPGLADTPAQNFNQEQAENDTYGLFFPNTPNNTVSFGGQSSNVAPVDGNGSVSTFSFGAKELRGLMVRMDIMTGFEVAGRPTYEQWAAGVFGSANGPGSRIADPDGDGLVNEFEWIAGLDPQNLNPGSPLNELVIEILEVPGLSEQKQITFRPVVEGRTYKIEKRVDLAGGAWIALPADLPSLDLPLPEAPEVGQRYLVDPDASTEQGFYRLNIELE